MLKSLVPKNTRPAAKFFRTTEGIAFVFFGAVLFLIPLITSSLPPSLSSSVTVGKWVYIATVVARTGLKAVQTLAGETGTSLPTTPPQVVVDIEDLASKLGPLIRSDVINHPSIQKLLAQAGQAIPDVEQLVKDAVTKRFAAAAGAAGIAEENAPLAPVVPPAAAAPPAAGQG